MPAANPYVIAVGASDGLGTYSKSDDVVASFSTRGNTTRRPDLVAPGKSVISLRDPNSFIDVNYPTGLVPTDTLGRFFRGSGTSQAAAVTSGAAALLLQQRPTLTPDQVKKLLTSTTDAMPAADPVARGAGQLNVLNAANAATPKFTQTFPASLGTGSLELSRGSAHVSDPLTGMDLTGEMDIMGQAWNPGTWATACTAGTSWVNGTWNSRAWSGAAWAGTSWSGRIWTDWAWTDMTWTGTTWTGAVWDGQTWTSRTWSGRTWSGRTWSGGYWSGADWS
jgi:serine protease AprX